MAFQSLRLLLAPLLHYAAAQDYPEMNGMPQMGGAAGMPPMGGAAGMPPMGSPEMMKAMQQNSQDLMNNPAKMQAMMESPEMQELLNDPQKMKVMMDQMEQMGIPNPGMPPGAGMPGMGGPQGTPQGAPQGWAGMSGMPGMGETPDMGTPHTQRNKWTGSMEFPGADGPDLSGMDLSGIFGTPDLTGQAGGNAPWPRKEISIKTARKFMQEVITTLSGEEAKGRLDKVIKAADSSIRFDEDRLLMSMGPVLEEILSALLEEYKFEGGLGQALASCREAQARKSGSSGSTAVTELLEKFQEIIGLEKPGSLIDRSRKIMSGKSNQEHHGATAEL